jgi:hypothetical protein
MKKNAILVLPIKHFYKLKYLTMST